MNGTVQNIGTVPGKKGRFNVMKRFIALILAGTMLMGLLAGCGGGNSGNGSTDGAGKASTAAAAGDENSDTTGGKSASEKGNGDGEYYNVIMQWPTLGEAPAGIASVEEAVNAITGPEIGVTLTLEPVNAFSLANETALTISSGDKLDLCLSLFTGVGSLVNTGSIIPLDELCAKYGADIERTCGERLSGGYYGETLYGVPNAYMNGEQTGIVCRKDLLDKYGITIDENKIYTMNEVGEIFETVKAGEGDGFYCIAGTSNMTNLFTSFYPCDFLGATAASGALMLGDDFTSTDIINIFATDEYKEFADTMYEWAQKGFFPADAATNTEDGSSQIKAGNYLANFQGYVGSATEEEFSVGIGTEAAVIKTIGGHSMANMFQSILWSIPTTCENPDKTMEFLNYIYKDDRIGNLLQYGVEGQDYVIVEQNEKGTVIDYPEGLDNTTIPYYCPMGIFGNRLNQPVYYPMPVDFREKNREFSESIDKFSPALGYCFVLDNVASEYSAVSSVISQYAAIISCGAVDPEVEVPEFLKALEAAGIEKVMEENRSQFNAWLEKNK